MRQPLTIGKLAKESAVSIDSIRFYERRGLLVEPSRSASNYRIYPADTAARLKFIKKTQRLGFSLDEIKELLALRQTPNASKADVKLKTEQKISDVRSRIAKLKQILRALEQLNDSCDGHGSITDCPILAALANDDSHKCHH